ncbi:sulfate adenylyltransferase [Haloparvum alkalitolerans]|uniref:sulfate adenylyltransferase n=1 Tax=Haloparvum alkalitolerans TaxID=1042953 RepID=UPI003CF41625
MIEPHGGSLINRMVQESTHRERVDDIGSLPRIQLDERLFQDAMNIANGRYSPLKGFMSSDDFLKVVHDRTLEDGTVWPLPVVIDVDADLAAELEPDERAALVDPAGDVMGTIAVEEIYKFNKQESATHVFGTDDTDHPGVAEHLSMGDFLVGGPIDVFEGYRYNESDLHPKESRVLFREYGWDRVVGFQTRNAPHRGHEYIQKCALERTDGILIQPKLGEKKAGDYQDDVILSSYQELIEHYYPSDHVALSVFPSRMRYAGPREAVFDAIVRKNQGCTHFIIGRDHAGVGDYYRPEAAHDVFEEIGDIGITPMLFEHAFYCRACDGMCSRKICPHGDEERIYPSGSKIRELVKEDQSPSEKIMRPEIAEFIMERDDTFVGN